MSCMHAQIDQFIEYGLEIFVTDACLHFLRVAILYLYPILYEWNIHIHIFVRRDSYAKTMSNHENAIADFYAWSALHEQLSAQFSAILPHFVNFFYFISLFVLHCVIVISTHAQWSCVTRKNWGGKQYPRDCMASIIKSSETAKGYRESIWFKHECSQEHLLNRRKI